MGQRVLIGKRVPHHAKNKPAPIAGIGAGPKP
jgi:hypothetical protein